MKFDFSKYKGKEVAMHCKTLQEARDFCKEMNKVGLTWCNNENYTENIRWSVYGDGTCYAFRKGQFGHKDTYRAMDYIILEWSDFMNVETHWEHYKDELMPFLFDNDTFAVKTDGSICECRSIICQECIFYIESPSCSKLKKAWANSPYKPPFNEQEWVKEWYKKYLNDDNVVQIYLERFDITVVIDKKGKTGISKCLKADKFDSEKGIAIAYARYCGVDIPKEL